MLLFIINCLPKSAPCIQLTKNEKRNPQFTSGKVLPLNRILNSCGRTLDEGNKAIYKQKDIHR